MNDWKGNLTTESINECTRHIDECSTIEMLYLVNEQDKLVPLAVRKEIPQIAKAVDLIYESLNSGGRMFYIGAGTSGRLGVLDASECPPTFGTPADLVQAYIAGGDLALRTAVENCEDIEEDGTNIIKQREVSCKDIVVGISASGLTAFVSAAIKEAKARGARTIGLSNNDIFQKSGLFDVCITPLVGPEVIAGSTRMKAGTAQKLVLNMLTTCTMIKLGKVYNNLMIDMKANNQKLHQRAIRMIQYIVETDAEHAAHTLKMANGDTKAAIVMLRAHVNYESAIDILKRHNGMLKETLFSLRGNTHE